MPSIIFPVSFEFINGNSQRTLYDGGYKVETLVVHNNRYYAVFALNFTSLEDVHKILYGPNEHQFTIESLQPFVERGYTHLGLEVYINQYSFVED